MSLPGPISSRVESNAILLGRRDFGAISLLSPMNVTNQRLRARNAIPLSWIPVVQAASPRASQMPLLRQGGGDLHERANDEVLPLRRDRDEGEKAGLLRVVEGRGSV